MKNYLFLSQKFRLLRYTETAKGRRSLIDLHVKRTFHKLILSLGLIFIFIAQCLIYVQFYLYVYLYRTNKNLV